MDFDRLQTLIDQYVERFGEQPPLFYLHQDHVIEALEKALEVGRPIDPEKDLGIPPEALV